MRTTVLKPLASSAELRLHWKGPCRHRWFTVLLDENDGGENDGQLEGADIHMSARLAREATLIGAGQCVVAAVEGGTPWLERHGWSWTTIVGERSKERIDRCSGTANDVAVEPSARPVLPSIRPSKLNPWEVRGAGIRSAPEPAVRTPLEGYRQHLPR